MQIKFNFELNTDEKKELAVPVPTPTKSTKILSAIFKILFNIFS